MTKIQIAILIAAAVFAFLAYRSGHMLTMLIIVGVTIAVSAYLVGGRHGLGNPQDWLALESRLNYSVLGIICDRSPLDSTTFQMMLVPTEDLVLTRLGPGHPMIHSANLDDVISVTLHASRLRLIPAPGDQVEMINGQLFVLSVNEKLAITATNVA